MDLNWSDLGTAIGLLLIIEGIIFALFPQKIRAMIEFINQIPLKDLQAIGAVAALIGFIIVWFVRG